MNEESLEQARENAHRTNQKITLAIPMSLAQREEHLLKRIQRMNGNALKKLEVLYSFMDELYSFVAKFTPCKIGCDHCCHYKVTIIEPEVQYIEKAAKITRRLAILNPEFSWQPCPFLKNSTCSIYKYRPFVCRRYVALWKTSSWCKVENEGESLPMLSFTEVDKCYDFIAMESGFVAAHDIRFFFNIGT
jgi:hypothetical protein